MTNTSRYTPKSVAGWKIVYFCELNMGTKRCQKWKRNVSKRHLGDVDELWLFADRRRKHHHFYTVRGASTDGRIFFNVPSKKLASNISCIIKPWTNGVLQVGLPTVILQQSSRIGSNGTDMLEIHTFLAYLSFNLKSPKCLNISCSCLGLMSWLNLLATSCY